MSEQPFVVKRWYEGLTGYHWLVLVVASLGWMFDTMDQWLYVLARQPAITDLLGPGATEEAIKTVSGDVQNWFIFGWATGGLLFGMIGDKIGRTWTMAITVLMYATFTGLSGLATSWEWFAFFRFMTGLGIGGEIAAGAALIAEVFPAYARPTALGIMQASAALGNVLAGLISYTVFTWIPTENSWRIIFYVGFVPALLVFAIRMFIKEPERWHEAKAEAARTGIKVGSMIDMFVNPMWRYRAIVGVLLGAVGVIGFWGIGTFSPDLLRSVLNPDNLPELKKFADTRASLAVMAQNVGAFFGILVFAHIAERFNRRTAFFLAFFSCLIAVPATFHFTTSFALALVLYPVMGFCLTSLFGLYSIYFPELFPTRLRATGTGLCYNVARYLALLGPFAFTRLNAAVGIANAATIVSVVFIFGMLVLIYAPETKGEPLPE